MAPQTDESPLVQNDDFAPTLVRWQRLHGRHDLPWQHGDAYGVWVSEIMLQQTQVQTVIGYYGRFMARFPTLAALAEADEGSVMESWSGLGYYARARNLHRAARAGFDQMQRHGGVAVDHEAETRVLHHHAEQHGGGVIRILDRIVRANGGRRRPRCGRGAGSRAGRRIGVRSSTRG